MSKRKSNAAEIPATDALAGAAGGNVDKIRDILFGRQMRDYDRRFETIEASLERQLADMRAELSAQLGTLETFVRGELGALGDRLKAERSERQEGDATGERAIEAVNRALDKRVAEVSERTANAEQEIRQVILETTRTLQEELRRKYTDLSTRMESGDANMRERKVDRATLASLFTEVALQLNDELDMGGLVAVAGD